FMFPNPYAVYLHDTPARALFRKPQRTFSSGCIRVEHPMALAELLLEGSPWTAAALDSVLAAGAEQTISLPQAIPVVVLYWTAWSAQDGTVNFRADVYERDAAVLRALDGPWSFH
ncbi:MAG: murein L,D-transpeptidase, partial [Candidatus Aminicenantes bacterium]